MTRRKRKEQERQRQMRLHAKSRMCGKKRKFETEFEADAYAKKYNDPRYGTDHSGQGTLRSYWCPHCHNYHLTSKPKVEEAHA